MPSKVKKHILIVEDDVALNDAFATVLKKEGFRVSRAFDGEEALMLLEGDPADLILLDIIMPVMDGIEFLRRFGPKTRQTPVVVFSNLDRQKDIDEVYRLGAAHYMLKAWASPKELIAMVKRILKSKAHRS